MSTSPEDVADAEMGALVRAYEQRLALGNLDAAVTWFSRRYPETVARLRRAHGLIEVPGAPADYFQTRLPDGTLGYFQRRTDDCEQAAVATCLQVPPHKVPDLLLHEQLFAGVPLEEIVRRSAERMDGWYRENGITVRYVDRMPTAPRNGRWIAVVGDDVGFNSHCLVMSWDAVLFDPSRALPGADPFDWGSVNYGMTLD